MLLPTLLFACADQPAKPGLGAPVVVPPDVTTVPVPVATTPTTPVEECGLEPAWVVQLASWSTDTAVGVGSEPDGTIVVVGSYDRELILGYNTATPTTLPEVCASPHDELYLAWYDLDGGLVRTARAGGCGYLQAEEMAMAPDGDVLVAGKYDGAPTFAVDEATPVELPAPEGNDNIPFLARYRADGTLRWVRTFNGPRWSEYVHGMSVDQEGNTYLTGEYEESLTFGAGTPQEYMLVATPLSADDPSNTDIFVASYDADGVFRWAQTAGTQEENEYGCGVARVGSEVLASASLSGIVTLAEGSVNEITLTTGAAASAPILRYDAQSGAFVTARVAAADKALTLVPLAGDRYATSGGLAHPPITFGADEANETSLDHVGFYIAVYDSADRLVWVTGTGADEVGSITVEAIAERDDQLAVAGRFEGVLSLLGAQQIPGSFENFEAFTAIYGDHGQVLCQWAIGGPDDDYGDGVAFDAEGGIVVVGGFRQSITVAEGTPAQADLVVNNGSTDLFLVRYRPKHAP